MTGSYLRTRRDPNLHLGGIIAPGYVKLHSDHMRRLDSTPSSNAMPFMTAPAGNRVAIFAATDAMTAWKRCECAGDTLSARAMLAACGAVAPSNEALEGVAAARARGYPGACIASGEFAHLRRFPAPCGGAFSQVAGGLSLTTGNLAAPSRTQPDTRLNCL
jgi:hypothetical protein